jgi:putative hydrolase of the HAD superfamily
VLELPLRAAFWTEIDHVLLDLDGTLLDLHYDTHFWHEVVPTAWGAARGLDMVAARAALQPRFKACEGTLDWYCTTHWSRELGFDVVALKRRDSTRIGWLPGARDFVRAARARGKRVVLATNSHPEVLAIKDERAGVYREFDRCFSSHTFGAPKEHAGFWTALHAAEPFDPARTLFVDDSLPVLRAARAAGVAHIYCMRKPDSIGTVRPPNEFIAVDAVAELLRDVA